MHSGIVYTQNNLSQICVCRLQQLTNEVTNSETATDCVHDGVCQLENIYMSHMFLGKLYCSTVLAYKLYMGKLYMSNITVLAYKLYMVSALCLSDFSVKLVPAL